jgi:cyanophycin synthetase
LDASLNADDRSAWKSPVIDPAEIAITRLRPLRGPNYWRLAPVIACDLRLGSAESIEPAQVPGCVERLLAALPRLRAWLCAPDRSGSGTRGEPIGWPGLLARVALELQSSVGPEVSFSRAVRPGDGSGWWVIVEYQEEEVGLQAVRDGLHLVRACATAAAVDVAGIIAGLRELYDDVRYGPSTAVIVEEARRRGIPVRRVGTGSMVQLGLGKHLRRIRATATDATSIIATDVAQNKDLTKRLLQNIGLAVPAGAIARRLEGAVEAAQEIGYPVILKPLDGNHGRGISPRLDTAAQLEAAWTRTAERYGAMVVERCIPGRDHRVLVVDGTVQAVAERVPAHVVGDGVRSIRELIEEVNRDPRRGLGHTNLLTRIPLDDATEEYLRTSGRGFEAVPARGEWVSLRATANLSTGGTSVDRTDEIHPDNVTACEMAAAVIGLDIAGLDVMTPDISVPFKHNGAVILEVNALPGIRMHTHPAAGRPRNVAGAILDMLYPSDSPASIPVVAVTGTNGKTTTTRLIAHLFRTTGRTVGFTTTDGVYLQNRLVLQGDMTGPFAANVVLSNPTVEVAVLETARGGILRSGLGFDECDVGVVLNVSGDHLGVGGIQTLDELAEIKSVVPAVVKRRGHAVLNADDPLVYAMRERTQGDVVLFTTRADRTSALAEEHVAAGGTAAGIEHDEFVIRQGRLCIPIAAVADVPLTLQGLARFQYGNILASIAAAYVQGMRYDEIRAGLLSFFPSPAITPGRLNVLRACGGFVLVDYAHNPAAVAGLMEVVAGMDARRRIGVIACPGDRRDEDVREVGRLCGALDHAILKEDDDRRGRPPGEAAQLLAEGLASAGLGPERIETVYHELDAVTQALDLMRPRDLVVVLADDVEAVLGRVRRRGTERS